MSLEVLLGEVEAGLGLLSCAFGVVILLLRSRLAVWWSSTFRALALSIEGRAVRKERVDPLSRLSLQEFRWNADESRAKLGFVLAGLALCGIGLFFLLTTARSGLTGVDPAEAREAQMLLAHELHEPQPPGQGLDEVASDKIVQFRHRTADVVQQVSFRAERRSFVCSVQTAVCDPGNPQRPVQSWSGRLSWLEATPEGTEWTQRSCAAVVTRLANRTWAVSQSRWCELLS